MGTIFSKISTMFGLLSEEREYKILILGLCNAGKTTLLNRIEGSVTDTDPSPTICFNMEHLSIHNVKMQVWDLGGQQNIRRYWSLYFSNVDGVIFVIDSTDPTLDAENKSELDKIKNNELLSKSTILILANKADLSESRNEKEIADMLDLPGLSNYGDVEKETNNIYLVKEVSAKEGNGITESIEWMSEVMRNNNSQ